MKDVTLHIKKKIWLTKHVFEVTFERGADIHFSAGQKVMVSKDGVGREYTLASGPLEPFLKICVRLVEQGHFSSRLAQAAIGDVFSVSNPYGYFTYKSKVNPAVFIATGTGIAPFVSFAKNGVSGFTLLHGVQREDELYYQESLRKQCGTYLGCLTKSQTGEHSSHIFYGRVTHYLERYLEKGKYDFYLCGNGNMIGEAVGIIDHHFPTSRIFTEPFFHNGL